MPRTPFLDLPPARQRALLDAAGRQAAAHGFRGASLNAILAEAGVSKGVAYYYFDDKADLLATVLEDAWAAVRHLLPDDAVPLWPALHRLHRAHLQLIRERPWLARLAEHPLPEEVAVRLAPVAASMEGMWRRALAEGSMRTDLPADLVLEMVRGLDRAIDGWWADHPEATAADGDRAFTALRALLDPTFGGVPS